MGNGLDRLWRIGGTGVAFAFFGLGGGLLALTVFPLFGACAPSRELAQKRVRYAIHRVFRVFLWFVQAIGVIDVKIERSEKLASCRGCLIVANHPTLIDVVILMAQSPNFQCVVKYQLWQNFFLRGVVSAAGFIRNDLSTAAYLEQCEKAFADGANLLVFPEGTRTVPGEKPRFLRGFANIAILSQADIQIVIIRCQPITLTRNKPWYSVPKSRPCFHVRVGELWDIENYKGAPHRSLNARHLVRALENHYQKALSNE